MGIDIYKSMGLTKTAKKEQIREAYYSMALKQDLEKDSEEFKRVTIAYEILMENDAKTTEDSSAAVPVEESIADKMKIKDDMNNGSYETALNKLLNAEKEYPFNEEIIYLLATCYAKTNRHLEAYSRFRKLAQLDSNSILYWNEYGLELFELYKNNLDVNENSANDMVEVFKTAIELGPNVKTSYLNLAKVYFYLKRYDSAISILEQSIKNSGKEQFEDFDALFLMCRIYVTLVEKDKLRLTKHRILKIVPQTYETRKLSGRKFYREAIYLLETEQNRLAFEFLTAATNLDQNVVYVEKLEGCRRVLSAEYFTRKNLRFKQILSTIPKLEQIYNLLKEPDKGTREDRIVQCEAVFKSIKKEEYPAIRKFFKQIEEEKCCRYTPFEELSKQTLLYFDAVENKQKPNLPDFSSFLVGNPDEKDEISLEGYSDDLISSNSFNIVLGIAITVLTIFVIFLKFVKY